MKKALYILLISFIMMIVFRGPIYRLIIDYTEIGNRTEVQITNKNLIQKINSLSQKRMIELSDIVKIARGITTEELKFTSRKTSQNPNELINTNLANCIGYSTMFNSIANYLIRQNNLQNEIIAEHKIGELYLLGINLHQFVDNPFFKDHDFNEIVNTVSGERILIDPSVSDYFRIHRITKKD